MSHGSAMGIVAQRVVRLSETVTLKRKGEYLVRGEVMGNQVEDGDYVFTPDRNNLGRKGILAASSIHSLVKGGPHFVMAV